ncbi:MAG TPA: hypothetical protein VEZ24_02870 [Microvirga sp.]|nr:hypothetical protein [Microvirga sp.]
MFKTAIVFIACVWSGSAALACDDPTHLRQLKRQAEALEVPAQAARQLERIERDRLKLEERAYRNRR